MKGDSHLRDTAMEASGLAPPKPTPYSRRTWSRRMRLSRVAATRGDCSARTSGEQRTTWTGERNCKYGLLPDCSSCFMVLVFRDNRVDTDEDESKSLCAWTARVVRYPTRLLVLLSFALGYRYG
ncbi:hypothetical protein FA13DRAFT_140626 [Coprinellus micaceus]|uniref:Uncharacterized protein n=1 Tax=Coprinellus micaceus TaxID=71717 RepID=A0A4Y7SHI5_COPMI|nr:hypothetical protein FA13DRAFT_140626 [Coprinellus micaceus]